jgi:hypothetical protein
MDISHGILGRLGYGSGLANEACAWRQRMSVWTSLQGGGAVRLRACGKFCLRSLPYACEECVTACCLDLDGKEVLAVLADHE